MTSLAISEIRQAGAGNLEGEHGSQSVLGLTGRRWACQSVECWTVRLGLERKKVGMLVSPWLGRHKVSMSGNCILDSQNVSKSVRLGLEVSWGLESQKVGMSVNP